MSRRSLLLPPPNITGELHVGHYYCFNLAYIYASYHDFEVISGVDHAGLSAISKVDPGRQLPPLEQVERLKEWYRASRDLFNRQYEGWGVGFRAKHFSLDARFTQNVRLCYYRLKAKGYVEKGRSFLNCDVTYGGVISDAEVKSQTTSVEMFYLTYRSVEPGGQDLVVATTRPETTFNDVGLCVHPDDSRYRHLVGKKFQVPYFQQEVVLLTDRYVKQDFGTGVLKVTPRYSIPDWEIAERLELPLGTDIFDEDMRCHRAPWLLKTYENYSVSFTEMIRASSELVKVATYLTERDFFSYLSPQGKVSIPVIQVYREGIFLDLPRLVASFGERMLQEVEVRPKWGEGMVKMWLRKVRPWCLSRRISWGVSVDFDGVLDTWFNAALWPIIFGQDERYHLFDTLITGWDLVFFWYIKMCLISYAILDRPSFRQALFTALISDRSGKKMSKSSGNVLSPDTMVAEHGIDAMRLSVLHNSTDYKYVIHEVPGTVRRLLHKMVNVRQFLNLRHGDTVSKVYVKDAAYLDQVKLHFLRSIREMRFNEAYFILDDYVKKTLSQLLCTALSGSKVLDGTLLYAFQRLLEMVEYLAPKFYLEHVDVLEWGRSLEVIDANVDPFIHYQLVIFLRRFLPTTEIKLLNGASLPYVKGYGFIVVVKYER